MNKILKRCIIVAAIYGGCSLGYELGKSRTLGVLLKHDNNDNKVSVTELISAMQDDKRFKVRFVANLAKTFSKEV